MTGTSSIKRQVGTHVADRDPLERLDQARIDLAEHALIDARGIGKAVADDPLARVERRQDRARMWSSRAAANSIASASGPKGLAAPDSSTWRMISAPGEPPGSRVSFTPMPSEFELERQHGGLGRFAGPLPALKGDQVSLRL